jgi:hypothetical protein
VLAVVSAAAGQGPYVICPVLGSLVREGSLNVDASGNIQLRQLYDVMVSRLGITPERAGITISTGVLGNHVSDIGRVLRGTFSLKDLKGSFLDHQRRGDTGILLDGSFHEDAFQAFVNHSSDGQTLTMRT